jgi:hypothetical protein
LLTKLALRPSYRLAALLTAAHGVAGGLLAVVGLPAAITSLLALAVALSFLATVRRTALLISRDAVVALEWTADGGLSFQTRDGTWRAARLLPDSFVTPPLTVLCLATSESGARVRHVVLLPDSAGREEYRRLRVRLRWDRSALPGNVRPPDGSG